MRLPIGLPHGQHQFTTSSHQAAALLAQSGCSAVCNPQNGSLSPQCGAMDQWQLWPLRCKSWQSFMTAFTPFNGSRGTWNGLLLQLEITGTAIWINPFIGVLTITSLWPVAIIFMNTNSLLRSLNIVPKYAMYQVRLNSVWILLGFTIFKCRNNFVTAFQIFEKNALQILSSGVI